jgi:uncharacterized membrane protein
MLYPQPFAVETLLTAMNSESAVRQHLLDRLRRHNEDDAEHLEEELDASFLKQRVRENNWWATGWRRWVLVGWLTAMFIMALAPIFASGLGASFTVIGFGNVIAVLSMVYPWQQKKVVYEILAVMADPEYEPKDVYL